VSVARSFPVWFRGALHAAGTPLIAAEDRGLQLGLALFETFPVEDGHVPFLEDHLRRLERGAAELASLGQLAPASFDAALARRALRETIEAVLALPGARAPFVLRITLSAGAQAGEPVLSITGREPEPPPAGGVVVVVSRLRTLADPLALLKSTSRLRHVVAREEARRLGAFEALLLNEHGDVAEGTISNLFVVRERTLLTPGPGEGALDGILRRKLLSSFEREPLPGVSAAREGRVALEDLLRADELFLTNSTRRVIPVRTLLAGASHAERALPGATGPVTRAARERLLALEAAEREPGRRS